jgi:serine protease Do
MNRNLYNYRHWLLTPLFVGILLTVPFLSYSKSAELPESALDLRTAISHVAERNIPAVAHIEVTQRQEVANPLLPFENDPFFHYFFGNPNMPKKFKQELKGLGTGIIMDAQGHILTNNHVVGGASKINVLLSNGKQYPAELIGTDPKTDLAVIKVSTKKPLPHVTFGDSDQVKVGEWVVAIGHPRGLDQTVTQGIISAKHRQGITDPSSYQDFLQTDAAINPGNSGGPLLNLQGEVIGVNAAIASQSGGFEGIGFAIPSNMALHVAKQLIAHGKVTRGWLGVSIQELTPDLAKSFGLDTPGGALIADVVKAGPADKAGLKRGDIVIAFKDKEILHTSDLRNRVANTPIGQDVRVTVLRKGERQDFTVKIGNMEDATKMLSTLLKNRLGAEFRPTTPKEARDYHQLNHQQGVAIFWLAADGPLAKVGFEVGDIILQVNGHNVEGVQGFVDLVSSIAPNSLVTVLALDHNTGQTGYVQVVIK